MSFWHGNICKVIRVACQSLRWFVYTPDRVGPKQILNTMPERNLCSHNRNKFFSRQYKIFKITNCKDKSYVLDMEHRLATIKIKIFLWTTALKLMKAWTLEIFQKCLLCYDQSREKNRMCKPATKPQTNVVNVTWGLDSSCLIGFFVAKQ